MKKKKNPIFIDTFHVPKHLVTTTLNREITSLLTLMRRRGNSLSNLFEVACLLSSMFRDLVPVARDGPPWERLGAEARRC